MLQCVNEHVKQKEKYSISKESNEFANQFALTLKEIGIKAKTIEAAKNMKKQKRKD